MKKKLWLALLCLALLCMPLLQGCSPEKVVVAKVGDDTVTVGEVNVLIDFILLQYGMSRADFTDAEEMKNLNESALDSAVLFKVVMQKAEEKGVYPFSASNQKDVDDQVSQYASTAKQYGMTEDDLIKFFSWQKAYDLMQADAIKGVQVADADVKAEYDRLAGEQKASYEADASAYETAKGDGSTVVVYKPRGYRYIKHILITMPQDIASQISTAQSSGDTEGVKKLREDGLKQIKTKADEVLAKVKNGGDFDALMKEYGGDPGMQQEPESKTGYEVGSATQFMQEFKDAALGLKNVGDVTDLVATDYGYHIIKWVGVVPEGPVKYDDVKESIKATLLQAKQTEAWNAAIEKWKAAVKIEQHAEKIPVNVAKPTATA